MKLTYFVAVLYFQLIICEIDSTPKILSNDLDSMVKDIVWCGDKREHLFALTELSSIYQSSDRGISWKKLNDIFHNHGVKELESHENEIGKVSKMLQSQIDKNLMIFLGTHGINWLVEECGKKVRGLNHGRKIQEYIFHPTERNWGLASAFTICEDFVDEPCRYYKELFVTKDLGESWELIASYVVEFSWGVYDADHLKNSQVPKERILITYEPHGKGNQKMAGWNYKVDFVYSDDFFKTTKIGAQKGNKYMLGKDFIFLAQVVDQERQEVTLLVSSSKENSYTFSPIDLNLQKFSEHSYTFLDSSEGSIFLHVNHFGDKSKYGHVYVSDAEGKSYIKSLNYNLRTSEGDCEFSKLNGIEGIYISNVIDDKIMEDHKLELENEMDEDDEMSEKKHSKNKHKRAKDELNDFIKTLITFNKGGKWQRLKAPEKDSQGASFDCGKECYLNLHGISAEYPPFYSVDSALGLLVGNGNVGKYLSFTHEDISTFLSRDGGLNWFEVRKGSHIYEIGDHGGLILLAEEQKPTNKLLYSWDEGLNFHELEFSKEKIQVRNIIIEPSSTALYFLVYGEAKSKDGEKKGVLITIDFATQKVPYCKDFNNPNSAQSDYEIWTPNDGRGGNKECLMGKKTMYVRRKRDSQCYNPIDFERKITVEICKCTDEDYECDSGFTRNSMNDPCTALNSNHISQEERNRPPSKCNNYYTVSKGYRKVPGNQCRGGVEYDPIIIPCPNNGLFSSISIIIFLVLFISLIVLIVMAFNRNLIQDFGSLFETAKKKNLKKEYINIEEGFEYENDNVLIDENEKASSEKK